MKTKNRNLDANIQKIIQQDEIVKPSQQEQHNTTEARIKSLEEQIFNVQGSAINHTLDQRRLSKSNPFSLQGKAESENKAVKFVSVSCTDLNYITAVDPKCTKKPNHQSMEVMIQSMKENIC